MLKPKNWIDHVILIVHSIDLAVDCSSIEHSKANGWRQSKFLNPSNWPSKTCTLTEQNRLICKCTKRIVDMTETLISSVDVKEQRAC